MFELDLRALYTNYFLTDLVCLFVLLFLWYQTRGRYKGIFFLVLDAGFQLICLILMFFQGQIPDFISIIVSNTFSITGALLGFIGLEYFAERKRTQLHNYLLIVIFFIVQSYFTFIHPNATFRELNSTIVLFVIWLQCALLIFVRASTSLRRVANLVGFVFVGLCILSLIRVLEYIISFQNNIDTLHLAYIQEYSIIYQLLMLLFAFFMVLIVNKDLLGQITLHEAKYASAFHSVPYSIVISNYYTGEIIDVNDGFERIFGHKAKEVIGGNASKLNIWLNSDDRNKFLSIINNESNEEVSEFSFRSKTGKIIHAELRGQVLMVDNEKCILSIINDISKQKQAEQELKASQYLLRKYTLHLQNEGEEEKVLLAAQIDNELNQSLTALRMEIGTLKKQVLTKNINSDTEDLVAKLDQSYKAIGNTLSASISVMNNLRHEILHLMGFEEAIRYYIEEFQIAHYIECEFNCSHEKIAINQTVSTSLFRIFQSAMTNVAEHSNASEVTINLYKTEIKLLFEIIDNGVGFEYKKMTALNTNGLLMMKERVSLMEGTLDIISAPGKGTKIKIEIPHFEGY